MKRFETMLKNISLEMESRIGKDETKAILKNGCMYGLSYETFTGEPTLYVSFDMNLPKREDDYYDLLDYSIARHLAIKRPVPIAYAEELINRKLGESIIVIDRDEL